MMGPDADAAPTGRKVAKIGIKNAVRRVMSNSWLADMLMFLDTVQACADQQERSNARNKHRAILEGIRKWFSGARSVQKQSISGF
jgi:hypothetical protein